MHISLLDSLLLEEMTISTIYKILLTIGLAVNIVTKQCGNALLILCGKPKMEDDHLTSHRYALYIYMTHLTEYGFAYVRSLWPLYKHRFVQKYFDF